MLILNNGAYSFDFSRFVTSYCFDIDPSFDYNELCSGVIFKKYDLGVQNDKFFCDLDLSIDFTTSQAFYAWFQSVKGLDLTITTDLDLFFPFICSYTTCVIVDIREVGYLGSDIMTAIKKIKMRLYLKQIPIYNTSASEPPCFSIKGVWKSDYQYSNVINISEVGKTTSFLGYNNDKNNWTVDFNTLTKKEAYDLLSWFLTVRTDIVNITRNNLNSNNHNKWTNGETVTTWGAAFNIRSFRFQAQKNNYSCIADFVENDNRF